ncbi:WD40 repeat-like protein [Atractiella rhizophila]|nr:WD40 repeat-like protein [Atractiella rhizophila]
MLKEAALDFLARLPPEIALAIVKQLSYTDIATCQRVSKRWNELSTDSVVWKEKFAEMRAVYGWEARSPDLSEALQQLAFNEVKTPMQNWQTIFRDRSRLQKRWDTGKGLKMVAIKGHSDSVYCLQFDSEKIVTGSRDRTVKIWTHDGTLLKTLSAHKASVLCLRYDDKKGIMLTGSSDQTIVVWRMPDEWDGEEKEGERWDWKPWKVLKGHTMGVLDVEMNDKWLVSCSKDTTIKVWDARTFRLVRTITGHRGPVNGVQLRGDRIVSASGDSTMKLWDIRDGRMLHSFEGHERGLACVKYSTSGKYLATGSNDKTVKIWDVETGKCTQTLCGHDDLVRAVWFDDVRERLVSGSYDKSLKVWNTRTGELLMDIKRGHTSLVFDVAFDLRRIISCSHDVKILVLDFGYDLDTSRYLS